MAVQRGRWTSDSDGGVVVFLIGMRVTKPWRVRAWWPVAAAMPRMLRELQADPASGLLGVRQAVSPGGPLLVQYWRDLDALLAFAADPERSHRPAWREFHRRARDGHGAVGIWHETFVVPAGAHESVYVDMPLSGLAVATGAVPVGRARDAARQRLEVAAGA